MMELILSVLTTATRPMSSPIRHPLIFSTTSFTWYALLPFSLLCYVAALRFLFVRPSVRHTLSFYLLTCLFTSTPSAFEFLRARASTAFSAF